MSQTLASRESAIDPYRNRRLQHPDKAALVPYILGGRRYVCVLESERVLLCRKGFLQELGGSEWILQVSLAHSDRLRAKKRSARIGAVWRIFPPSLRSEHLSRLSPF